MMWLSSLQLRESYTKNGVPEYHYALFKKKKKKRHWDHERLLHHGNSRVRKPLRMWSYELRHTDDVLHTEMDQKLHRTCWSTPNITLEERTDTQASDTDVSKSLVQNSQMLEVTPKPSHCRMDRQHTSAHGQLLNTHNNKLPTRQHREWRERTQGHSFCRVARSAWDGKLARTNDGS